MKLQGIGVGAGIAVGTVLQMPEPLPEPVDTKSTEDSDVAVENLKKAVGTVAAGLQARAGKVSGAAKEVLDAQVMMTSDPSLVTQSTKKITAGKTAERAIFEVLEQFKATFTAMGGYMAERATDLNDLSQRIIAELRGVSAPGVPESDSPFVLVARDLAPADTALLDIDKVLALVTSDGGPTAHTAILARQMGIPAIVGVKGALEVADGTEVIVNAGTSEVTTEPSEQEKSDAREQAKKQKAAAEAPLTPGALADGTQVLLVANLGKVDDAEKAVAKGAEGVGLFRTEVMFLDTAAAPTVEFQEASFRKLFEAFPGQKVVIRVLDAGADKPLSFLNDSKEENPALGLRGIRVLREKEQILRDQLQAIANAAAGTEAKVWVMAPMVATVEEANYFADLAHSFGLDTAGVMVETPAAALLADKVLQVADFASIGTNDLTQYTMAADRLLGSVGTLQDPWYPAVLKLIAEVGKAGLALDKSVGICGEAAADPMLAVVLIGLGARSLSMSINALAGVRYEIKQYTLDQAEQIAAVALNATSAADAREQARAKAKELLGA